MSRAHDALKRPWSIVKRVWMRACLAGCLAWAFSSLAAAHGPGADDFEPATMLLKFKFSVSPDILKIESERLGFSATASPDALRQAWLQHAGLQPRDAIPALGVERVRLAVSDSPAAAMRRSTSALIEFIQPNYRRQAIAVLPAGPNDPIYQDGRQWWLEAIAADRVLAENILPLGQPVVIAILDSGIRLDHEDLAGRLVPGHNFIDPFLPPDDDSSISHGTHVAGIAGALTNNGIGVAGTAVSSAIRLMPLKILDANGSGYDYTVAQGIVWAVDHGARVLNLSFGGPSPSTTLEQAIRYARLRGCVVVAASGNEALEYNPVSYPAAIPEAIAVAACNRQGDRAVYSQYHTYVDIAAPGGDGYQPQDWIWSTSNTGSQAYVSMIGTSMATPMVAGAAAMLFSQNPNRTPSEVEDILMATAVKIGSLVGDTDGWNPELGWGRVNLYQALKRESTFSSKKTGNPSYPFPNPFHPARGETVRVLIPMQAGDSAGDVVVRITDAAGYPVITLRRPAAEVWPGQTITWDGRNASGQAVANGVYPYRLEHNGIQYVNKILVTNP